MINYVYNKKITNKLKSLDNMKLLQELEKDVKFRVEYRIYLEILNSYVWNIFISGFKSKNKKKHYQAVLESYKSKIDAEKYPLLKKFKKIDCFSTNFINFFKELILENKNTFRKDSFIENLNYKFVISFKETLLTKSNANDGDLFFEFLRKSNAKRNFLEHYEERMKKGKSDKDNKLLLEYIFTLLPKNLSEQFIAMIESYRKRLNLHNFLTDMEEIRKLNKEINQNKKKYIKELHSTYLTKKTATEKVEKINNLNNKKVKKKKLDKIFIEEKRKRKIVLQGTDGQNTVQWKQKFNQFREIGCEYKQLTFKQKLYFIGSQNIAIFEKELRKQNKYKFSKLKFSHVEDFFKIVFDIQLTLKKYMDITGEDFLKKYARCKNIRNHIAHSQYFFTFEENEKKNVSSMKHIVNEISVLLKNYDKTLANDKRNTYNDFINELNGKLQKAKKPLVINNPKESSTKDDKKYPILFTIKRYLKDLDYNQKIGIDKK